MANERNLSTECVDENRAVDRKRVEELQTEVLREYEPRALRRQRRAVLKGERRCGMQIHVDATGGAGEQQNSGDGEHGWWSSLRGIVKAALRGA
jgi:hypothetical protein